MDNGVSSVMRCLFYTEVEVIRDELSQSRGEEDLSRLTQLRIGLAFWGKGRWIDGTGAEEKRD